MYNGFQIVEIDVPGQENTSQGIVYVATAATSLSSGRVVTVINGLAAYFDPNDVNVYGLLTGITRSAVLTNEQVEVQLSGLYYEAGLGLVPGEPYYAGVNGTLVLDPSGVKLIQMVGNTLDADTLNVNINSQPIETI